jgi:hypothetical protein
MMGRDHQPGMGNREFDIQRSDGPSRDDASGRGLTIALALVLGVFVALVLALLIR